MAMLLVATSCSSDQSTTRPAADSRTGVSDTAVLEGSTALRDAFGEGTVTFAGPDVDGGTLTAVPVEASELPPLPDGIRFLGTPMDVSGVSGMLPVEVSAPLGGVESRSVRFAHLNGLGQWEFAEPFSDGESVWVVTNDFSPVGFVWDEAGDALGSVWSGITAAGDVAVATGDWVADGFTGRSDPPEDCDLLGGDGVSWADHTGSPGNGFVHVCMRNRGEGRVEVVVRSNRAEPVEVLLPDSVSPDWVWIEGTSDWATAVFRALGSTNNSIVLGPGREMTVGFSQPLGTPEPFEIWVYQTGAAQAWGELSSVIGSWSGNELAFMAVTCLAGETNSPLREQVESCVQEGLPVLLEEVSVGILEQQLDDAYERFAQAVDGDAMWYRSGPDYFAEQFKSYRGDVLRRERWKKRISTFFKAVNIFRTGADIWTNVAVGAWAADDANVSRVFLDGRCRDQGPVVDMTVTADGARANVKTAPDVSAVVVGSLLDGAEVRVFLDSVRVESGRSWVRVWLEAEEECAWIEANRLVRGDGTRFGPEPICSDAPAEFSDPARQTFCDLLSLARSGDEGALVARLLAAAPHWLESQATIGFTHPERVDYLRSQEPPLAERVEAALFGSGNGAGTFSGALDCLEYYVGIDTNGNWYEFGFYEADESYVDCLALRTRTDARPFQCHGTEGGEVRLVNVDSDDTLNIRNNAGVGGEVLMKVPDRYDLFVLTGIEPVIVDGTPWVVVQLPGPEPFEEPAQYGCGLVHSGFLDSPTATSMKEEILGSVSSGVSGSFCSRGYEVLFAADSNRRAGEDLSTGQRLAEVVVAICQNQNGDLEYYGREIASGLDIRLAACQAEPEVWVADDAGTKYTVVDERNSDRGAVAGGLSIDRRDGSVSYWEFEYDEVLRNVGLQDGGGVKSC